MVHVPPHVYLDSSHWIDLAEGRIDVAAFDDAASTGAIVPTLSFAHLSDLGMSQNEAARRRCGKYIDRVRRSGHVVWIKTLNTVAADELQRLYEQVHLRREGASQHSPFSARMVDSMDFKNHGDPTRLEAAAREERQIGVEGMIEHLRVSPKRAEYVEFRSNLPETTSRVRDSRREAKRFSSVEERGLVAFIVDKARLSFAKGEDRERFLDIVMERRDEIPALDLRLRYRQNGLLTNARAEPSDVEDYDHLAGFAYCDVAFADKRTRDALKRGGCAKLPRANASFERWLRDEV